MRTSQSPIRIENIIANLDVDDVPMAPSGEAKNKNRKVGQEQPRIEVANLDVDDVPMVPSGEAKNKNRKVEQEQPRIEAKNKKQPIQTEQPKRGPANKKRKMEEEIPKGEPANKKRKMEEKKPKGEPANRKQKVTPKRKNPPRKASLSVGKGGPSWKNNFTFRKSPKSAEKLVKKPAAKVPTSVPSLFEEEGDFDVLSNLASSSNVKTYPKRGINAKKPLPKPKARDIFDDLSSTSGSSIGSFSGFRAKKKVEVQVPEKINPTKKVAEIKEKPKPAKKQVDFAAAQIKQKTKPAKKQVEVVKKTNVAKKKVELFKKTNRPAIFTSDSECDMRDSPGPIDEQPMDEVMINVEEVPEKVPEEVSVNSDKENVPPPARKERPSTVDFMGGLGLQVNEATKQISADKSLNVPATPPRPAQEINDAETPRTRNHRSPLRPLSTRGSASTNSRINLPGAPNDLAEFIETVVTRVQANSATKRDNIRRIFQELRLKVDETLLKIEQELDAH